MSPGRARGVGERGTRRASPWPVATQVARRPVCAWRLCCLIPRALPARLDLGQWLCVPPFRMVCLCQVRRRGARSMPTGIRGHHLVERTYDRCGRREMIGSANARNSSALTTWHARRTGMAVGSRTPCSTRRAVLSRSLVGKVFSYPRVYGTVPARGADAAHRAANSRACRRNSWRGASASLQGLFWFSFSVAGGVSK
jgi:hypothetical protein